MKKEFKEISTDIQALIEWFENNYKEEDDNGPEILFKGKRGFVKMRLSFADIDYVKKYYSKE